MSLRQIDKNRYSRHYKIVFSAIVVGLIVISIGSSALLIRWLGNPGQSNFMLNLLGVVIAAVVVSYALYRLRRHPFMDEVVYVWMLKQRLNQIYRKQRRIEPLIDENYLDAMVIMNYLYQGSKQLYELDDNTITMDELALRINHLQAQLDEAGVTVTTDQYDPSMLERF